MKVRFSKLALAELDVISSDIGAENPRAAAQFDERIRRVLNRIAQFPESAQEVMNRPGVRRVPLVRYPYVIYYAIIDQEVMILHIRHEPAAILGNSAQVGLSPSRNPASASPRG